MEVESVSSRLVAWVDANFPNGKISSDLIHFGAGGPYNYYLDLKLPNDVLPFSHDIFRIGIMSYNDDEFYALYFSDQSRSGIVVQLKDAKPYGLDHYHVDPVSDRIGVFCYEKSNNDFK